MEKYIEKIPTWALPAIINDDYSGLEERDISQIREWLEVNDYHTICPPNEEDEPYFSWEPAIGTATDVYDCTCIIF